MNFVGKFEVSNVLASWADMMKKSAKRREPTTSARQFTWLLDWVTIGQGPLWSKVVMATHPLSYWSCLDSSFCVNFFFVPPLHLKKNYLFCILLLVVCIMACTSLNETFGWSFLKSLSICCFTLKQASGNYHITWQTGLHQIFLLYFYSMNLWVDW